MPSPNERNEDGESHPPGYDDFVTKLQDLHNERGTTLDLQARVNGKHIDLFQLWNIVTSRGGYDAVSAEKLAWRKVGQEFSLGAANAAAYAFALKTVYYKNLAAYEIKTIHNQEPPPKEILENLTAKGGDLLRRTVENFQAPASHESLGPDSDGSGDESKTPKEEKGDLDDPGSGGGRTTRGLRQAPPQRVLFQPDVSSSRQTRHGQTHAHSPQPAAAPTNNYNHFASSNSTSLPLNIANYEPRPPNPLTLRTVTTPGNNPNLFKERQRIIRDAKLAALGRVPPPSTKGMMKPGQGFDGPNIYVRTLQGLRSGIPEEQNYALHHLVKISHERGDKYKFDAFPNLAEALIEYVLDVSSLFYDVHWEIDYMEEIHGPNVLDGINGTPDVIERIESFTRVDTADEVELEESTHQLNKSHEAALTIRNLALLEDNAQYLSSLPQLRDSLSIILSLPKDPRITELKHYALDIAEQVTKYWSMCAEDPLYRLLLAQVADGSDRGAVLTSLRAISRISMNLEQSNLLRGIPITVLQNILNWTLLEDEELVSACLDFLYQFTAVEDNVSTLLAYANTLSCGPFLLHLTRLLQYHANGASTKYLVHQAVPFTASQQICKVPQDLLDEFLKLEEPERSTRWLKAVFEEDTESEITQIALWQAYQTQFNQYSTLNTPLLPAAEFIKNVSQVFTGANAQVRTVSENNSKFIIKGIRPRNAPATRNGKSYRRCLWNPSSHEPCNEFLLESRNMFDHIVTKHLGIPQKPEGGWDLSSASIAQPHLDCFWADCRHFARHPDQARTPFNAGMHAKTHLPERQTSKETHNKTLATQTTTPPAQTLKMTGEGRDQVTGAFLWHDTLIDERGDAAGLPLTSVLILRNLARNIPKVAALVDAVNRDHYQMDGNPGDWLSTLFEPLRQPLMYVMAHNRPITRHVNDLLRWIDRESG